MDASIAVTGSPVVSSRHRAAASMTSPRSAPRLLVTAGPTREPIDSVRFLSNRSSGRMGAAIAAAAASRGWPTTLLLGPVGELSLPDTVGVARFTTTDDLAAELDSRWPHHDILIMAAAVADYRPVLPRERVPEPRGVGQSGTILAGTAAGPAASGARSSGASSPGEGRAFKIARRPGRLVLELESTPDLLERLASRTRAGQMTVGFALEAEDLRRRAAEKLRRKRLDAIVANPLQTMDSEDVEGMVIFADGSIAQPSPGGLTKTRFARWLLDELEAAWKRRVDGP